MPSYHGFYQEYGHADIHNFGYGGVLVSFSAEIRENLRRMSEIVVCHNSGSGYNDFELVDSQITILFYELPISEIGLGAKYGS